jgi:hypothetical protein
MITKYKLYMNYKIYDLLNYIFYFYKVIAVLLSNVNLHDVT